MYGYKVFEQGCVFDPKESSALDQSGPIMYCLLSPFPLVLSHFPFIGDVKISKPMRLNAVFVKEWV